jgi:hypothetical protein
MKLYLLEQQDNINYDTYDSCVVCAENELDAVTIDPYGEEFKEPNGGYGSWASKIEFITCTEIGEANDQQERGVIIASFNAG